VVSGSSSRLPSTAALRQELAVRGLSAALGGGRLVELDAIETLRLFMRDGSSDPVLFQETVGSLVREHAAGAPLRAFGEMVDVLWEASNPVAALELERLWAGLQTACRSRCCAATPPATSTRRGGRRSAARTTTPSLLTLRAPDRRVGPTCWFSHSMSGNTSRHACATRAPHSARAATGPART
jgi:hypothetical protein